MQGSVTVTVDVVVETEGGREALRDGLVRILERLQAAPEGEVWRTGTYVLQLGGEVAVVVRGQLVEWRADPQDGAHGEEAELDPAALPPPVRALEAQQPEEGAVGGQQQQQQQQQEQQQEQQQQQEGAAQAPRVAHLLHARISPEIAREYAGLAPQYRLPDIRPVITAVEPGCHIASATSAFHVRLRLTGTALHAPGAEVLVRQAWGAAHVKVALHAGPEPPWGGSGGVQGPAALQEGGTAYAVVPFTSSRSLPHDGHAPGLAGPPRPGAPGAAAGSTGPSRILGARGTSQDRGDDMLVEGSGENVALGYPGLHMCAAAGAGTSRGRVDEGGVDGNPGVCGRQPGNGGEAEQGGTAKPGTPNSLEVSSTGSGVRGGQVDAGAQPAVGAEGTTGLSQEVATLPHVPGLYWVSVQLQAWTSPAVPLLVLDSADAALAPLITCPGAAAQGGGVAGPGAPSAAAAPPTPPSPLHRGPVQQPAQASPGHVTGAPTAFATAPPGLGTGGGHASGPSSLGGQAVPPPCAAGRAVDAPPAQGPALACADMQAHASTGVQAHASADVQAHASVGASERKAGPGQGEECRGRGGEGPRPACQDGQAGASLTQWAVLLARARPHMYGPCFSTVPDSLMVRWARSALRGACVVRNTRAAGLLIPLVIHAVVGPKNQRLLHTAAARGEAAVVSWLLRAGADVNVLDAEQRTALDLATDPAMVQLLLANGGQSGPGGRLVQQVGSGESAHTQVLPGAPPPAAGGVLPTAGPCTAGLRRSAQAPLAATAPAPGPAPVGTAPPAHTAGSSHRSHSADVRACMAEAGKGSSAELRAGIAGCGGVQGGAAGVVGQVPRREEQGVLGAQQARTACAPGEVKEAGQHARTDTGLPGGPLKRARTSHVTEVVVAGGSGGPAGATDATPVAQGAGPEAGESEEEAAGSCSEAGSSPDLQRAQQRQRLSRPG